MVELDLDTLDFEKVEEPGLILITETKTLSDLAIFCSKLNGTVGIASTKNKPKMLELLKSRGLSTSAKVWAGFTDLETEGIFKSDTNETLSPTNFSIGEPNGGRIENCATVVLNEFEFKDSRCHSDRYGFCVLTRRPSFTLRGDLGNEVDSQYFWMENLVNQKFSFRGTQNTQIVYQNSTWIVRNGDDEEVLLTLADTDYPFGLKTWTLPKLNQSLRLSFDNCKEGGM